MIVVVMMMMVVVIVMNDDVLMTITKYKYDVKNDGQYDGWNA